MLMYSDHIAQIVKAKLYAEDPERFKWVDSGIILYRGSESTHLLVRLQDGSWQCDCSYAWQSSLPCRHTRAVEQLLAEDGSRLEQGPGAKPLSVSFGPVAVAAH